jgi:hypothetical protein
MKILFDSSNNPYPVAYVKKCFKAFGSSYTSTVEKTIKDSQDGINKSVFLKNSARLLANFKMTRSGPFKGIRLSGEMVIDPNGILTDSWKILERSVLELKKFLMNRPNTTRERVLVEIAEIERTQIAEKLWFMFKRLLPLCMSETTLGLVGASKVLFSVFPEVALPIDNSQWKKLFQTVDYSDVIRLMATEIIEWERMTGQKIDMSVSKASTLPAIYNVMAMEARER